MKNFVSILSVFLSAASISQGQTVTYSWRNGPPVNQDWSATITWSSDVVSESFILVKNTSPFEGPLMTHVFIWQLPAPYLWISATTAQGRVHYPQPGIPTRAMNIGEFIMFPGETMTIFPTVGRDGTGEDLSLRYSDIGPRSYIGAIFFESLDENPPPGLPGGFASDYLPADWFASNGTHMITGQVSLSIVPEPSIPLLLSLGVTGTFIARKFFSRK